MSKAVKIGPGVLAGAVAVVWINSAAHSGSHNPTPAEAASSQRNFEEAMGGGSPSDDLIVAERKNPNTGEWIPYTAGQERAIASSREQCEVLLRRFKKGPDSRLKYDGQGFQWLCNSLPSVPGSANPADGWGS